MINKHIINKISKNVVSLGKFGMNDLAWKRKDVIKLIKSLMSDDIGILGGDIYEIDLENINPVYDNWSCEPHENESKKNYFLRSKLESLIYINKYPVYSEEKIVFSLSFTENVFEQVREMHLPLYDIRQSAEDIGKDWLYCSLCHDAWKSTSTDAMVRCPSCDGLLHNPKYLH